MKTRRIAYAIAAIVTILLGLASRRYSQQLPEFVATYAGDTLWALTAYLGVRMVFPAWKVVTSAFVALAFAFSIEISQLYHGVWIDQLRKSVIGGLILGYGFLWADLLCYCAGVGTGAVIDILGSRRK